MTALGGATTVAVLGYLVQCSTLGGAITVRAPLGGSEGSIFAVEDIDGNAGLSPITVLGNGSQLDDAPSFLINQGFGYSTWVYDRGQWRRLVTRRRLDGVGSDKVVNAGGGLNARALLLEFAADDATSGGAAAGDEVPLLADLLLVDDALEGDQTSVRVLSLASDFILDKTSSEPFDPLTVLPTLSGVGRWLRVPSGSRKWASQINWFIDPALGNDENVGDSAAAGHPLKTVAEACRRLTFAKAGLNYQFNLLGDAPVTDRWRLNFIEDQNPEAMLANFSQQTVNATLKGKRTVVASSTMTGAGYVPTAGGVQATLTDAAFPGGIAAHIGDMLVASNGATAFVLKDLGVGVARITDFVLPTNLQSGALPAATAYDIVRCTKWNGSIVQLGSSQGRYQFMDLEFPATVGAGPDGWQDITYRFVSITWRTCRFQRSLKPSVGSGTSVVACCFDYAAAGAPVVVGLSSGTFACGIGTGFIKANLQFTFAPEGVFLFGVCLQDSYIQTTAPGGFTFDYGATLPFGACRGVNLQISPPPGSAGKGLGIYDAPAVAGDAFLICDDAAVRVGAGSALYGTNPLCVNAVKVRGSSKLMIQDAVTPTIASGTNDLAIENALVAMPPLENSAAGPLPPLSPLTTWAQWVAAPFGRTAFNYSFGSAVVSVP